MNRSTHPLAALLAVALCVPHAVVAETWTDDTGKFQIEAEFAGVKGKSVLLKKSDGSTLEVPINRLSAESHALAKQLYTASMAAGSPAPAPAATAPTVTATPATPSVSPNSNLNFKVPVAPNVAPMPAFPENATLQATFDFCRDQVMAGHPEVFWHALPEDIRQMMDSQEFRSTAVDSMNSQQQITTQVKGLFEKLAEVLVSKKRFVLNTPMLTQAVPPLMMPTIQQGYDPAVGTVYELGMLLFDLPSMETQTMTEMMDSHGPKLGGHLKGIIAMLPPPMIQQAIASVVIQQSDDNNGTITVPGEPGPETVEMVRYMNRWIPKDLADEWMANKDSILSEMKTELAAAQQGEEAAQATMMAGMFITMAGGILDPMLAAKSQAEFDAALIQIMALSAMFGDGELIDGGGGDGGFPGGPGGFPGEAMEGPGGFPGEAMEPDGF